MAKNTHMLSPLTLKAGMAFHCDTPKNAIITYGITTLVAGISVLVAIVLLFIGGLFGDVSSLMWSGAVSIFAVAACRSREYSKAHHERFQRSTYRAH